MHKEKSIFVAYVIWLFTGIFGGHRFYLRRKKTGWAMALLFWGSIVAQSILYSIVLQALSGGTRFEGVLQSGTLYSITSIFAVMFYIWLVWWLLDLVFIYFMMKKDRQSMGLKSPAEMADVFE